MTKGPSPLNVLLLSRDPDWVGGVVAFVETLKASFGPSVCAFSFRIGRRLRRASLCRGACVALKDAIRLALHVRRGRYDVVHLNPSLNVAIVREGLFLLMLRPFGWHRVLVFIHGWDARWVRRFDASKVLRVVLRSLYGRCGLIVVLAQEFRAKLLEWGFDPARVTTLSTMFDSEALGGLRPDFERAPSRLLFLGRLVPEKGLLETLEGFALAVQQRPELRLAIAGSGSAEREAREWVAARSLSDRIEFVGVVNGNEKIALLRQSDVLLLPSRSEGCPVALLEAMASGMAAIVSRVGGIPDFFQGNVNGVMLDRVDPKLVAEAIVWLMEDRERLRKIRTFNHAMAWERFDSRVIAARLEELYRNLESTR